MVELLHRLFNFQPYNLSGLKTRAVIRGNNAPENTTPSSRGRGEECHPLRRSEPEILAGFVPIRRNSLAPARRCRHVPESNFADGGR